MSEELAWAAGFFDGEGNVYLQTHRSQVESGGVRRTPILCVQISQKDREPLDRFSRAVGVEGVRGPYKNGVKLNGEQSWIYRMATTGQYARHILTLLWPWLTEVRKAQATAKGFSPKRLDILTRKA